MPPAAPQTRIEWVEDQMRNAILLGELAPGERLLTAALAERFAVSPTPLREAMQRLTGEGLVEFTAQRGARVTPLSRDDCVEITELRCLLEPVALAHAAAEGDAAWRAGATAASAALLTAWRERDRGREAVELAYREFYEQAVSACRSARLRKYTRVIREQEARYRLTAWDSMDRDALERHHRAMVTALLEADLAELRVLLVAEVEEFARAYLAAAPTAGAGDGP